MQTAAAFALAPARPVVARLLTPAVAVWALGGAAAGLTAKLADESSVRWAADLGTYPALWVLVLVVVGWRSRTPGRAAVQSAAFFLAMTVTYYLYARLALGFAGGGHEGVWALAAVTVAPLAAAAAAWALRSARPPAAGAVLALLAALALAGGAVDQYLLAARGLLPPEVPLHPVQAVAELGVVVLAVFVAPRDWARRGWAAAMLLPAAWVVARIVDAGFGAVA